MYASDFEIAFRITFARVSGIVMIQDVYVIPVGKYKSHEEYCEYQSKIYFELCGNSKHFSLHLIVRTTENNASIKFALLFAAFKPNKN